MKLQKGDFIRVKRWYEIRGIKDSDGRPLYWNEKGKMDYLLNGAWEVDEVDYDRKVLYVKNTKRESLRDGYDRWYLKMEDCVFEKALNRFW